MGRIKELIKSFINPAPEEKSFDELALEAGIKGADFDELKNSINGVSGWNFDEEIEETKKGRKTKVASKEIPVQPTQKRAETERDLGMDR